MGVGMRVWGGITRQAPPGVSVSQDWLDAQVAIARINEADEDDSNLSPGGDSLSEMDLADDGLGELDLPDTNMEQEDDGSGSCDQGHRDDDTVQSDTEREMKQVRGRGQRERYGEVCTLLDDLKSALLSSINDDVDHAHLMSKLRGILNDREWALFVPPQGGGIADPSRPLNSQPRRGSSRPTYPAGTGGPKR